MSERTVELDTPVLTDETADALRAATDRAERAEAELARMKSATLHAPPAAEHSLKTAEHSSNAVEHSSKAAVHTDDLKQPPTPSTARNAATYDTDTAVGERGSAEHAESAGDGVEELRKDPMMAHLLDSLEAGTDVGHYGRLVFAMVARHFLPHAEVIAWMTKDNDFSPEQAQQMLHQVEGRDYTPPRRERLLQWQKEQEFQFMDVHDPDSGNLYRNLEFPKEVYDHIGHYQGAKASD